MSFSADNIQNKEFATKLRGYDPSQVQSHLNQVNDEFSKIVEENRDLKSNNQLLSKKLAEYTRKHDELNDSIVRINDRADKIIADAEQTATETIKAAEREASFITEEAEANSNTLLKESANTAKEIHQEIDLLRKQSAVYRQKLVALTENQLNNLHDSKWDQLLANDNISGLSDRAQKYVEDDKQNIEENQNYTYNKNNQTPIGNQPAVELADEDKSNN